MHIEYHHWYSHHLLQEMELKVYGSGGKPVLVFPSSGGRFYEYEDFGMVEACRPFIQEKRITLITVDSIDNESWFNQSICPEERARRHDEYVAYILQEVIPFIENRFNSDDKYMVTGCSLGAFHATNFLFHYPHQFDTLIALSGVYTLNFSVGDYRSPGLHLYAPLYYMPHLEDIYYIQALQRSHIILCSGQGAWEEETLTDTLALKEILDEKKIPCWVDIWGHDVCHDWPWWRRQMPYFLGELASLHGMG